MKSKVDAIVIICMMIALYINITSIPKLESVREVKGPLVKVEHEPTN
jgi:hypothetical protein